MKIVAIFDTRLFSFRFPREADYELKRLQNLWRDPQYIKQFIKDNTSDAPNNTTPQQLANQIADDVQKLEDYLRDLGNDINGDFEVFFKQLNNEEYTIKELSKRKGRKNYLRLYAIRISENCFVITGGAIKFVHKMKDSDVTKEELKKLERGRQYLKNNHIHDEDSFYEFLNEEEL